MWISKIINSDPEVKKTLKEISKLIKSYSDATNIRKQKFFLIDIGRLFKPRAITYFTIIFVVLIIEALLVLSGYIELSILHTWVRLSLDVSLPILVLGISLSTVAKSLSESSRFASEYLKESCKTTTFACITFLTVFLSYLSILLYSTIEGSIVSKSAYFLFSPFSIGGTIWCLSSLIYIVLETTKCMYPEISIEAASNYASRKLSYAVLKRAYLSAWMGKYSDILKAYLKDLENISQHWSKDMLQKKKEGADKSGEYKIYLPEKVDFHLGYRDYNLRKLKEINDLLESKNAKLYLAPHSFNSEEFGDLCYEEPCNEIYDKINEEISSICRFSKDKHIEEKESFWEEHYLKLYNILLRSIKNADMAQFRKYLTSIEDIYFILRRARKHSLIRKHFNLDYKEYRYLLLYSKSVKWLLESTKKIEEDILELFLRALSESIWQQAEDDIRNGDWYTLDLLKWLIPDTYKLFHELVKDKKSRLWELRGRIGSFYDFAGSLLPEYESVIKEDDKIQIQLVLHKGIISWLLIAIDNKDDELIKSLCVAAKKLVFPDKEMTFIPQQLVIQHFILCGKMLEFLMEKKEGVTPSIFKLLCFDKYDHAVGRNIDYEELVKFYIESRKCDLRSIFHEFSSTDWERNPLSGGGFGTPRFTFSGHIELDYMFIYLALLTIDFLSDVKTIPYDFSHYNLEEKIEKFADIAREIDIYDYKNSKDKLLQWIDGCIKLHEQQEAERIAESPLLPECVELYEKGFWEGYKERLSFLEFCVVNGHVNVDETAETKFYDRATKNIFSDKDLGTFNFGKQQGVELGRFAQNDIIKKITDTDKGHENTVDDIALMVKNAEEWLSNRGCTEKDCLLVVRGNKTPETWLLGDDLYRPRWREEKDCRFNGIYKNFQLKYIHEKDKVPQCTAIDLKGWRGLLFRSEFLTQKRFGEIEIRTWKDEEIDKAIEKGDVTEEQRDQAKGNCPVEVTLFWKWDEEKKPAIQTIALESKEEPNG